MQGSNTLSARSPSDVAYMKQRTGNRMCAAVTRLVVDIAAKEKITVEDMAKRLNMTKQEVRSMLRGAMSLDTAATILLALGYELGDITFRKLVT